MLWVVPAVMAAAGALEGDAKRRRNEKKLQAQAEIARWSPWTGMAPHDVSTEDSALHGAIDGGVAGIGMQQNMKGDTAKAGAGAGAGAEATNLTEDSGASSEPYTSTGDTSKYSLPPAEPVQAQPVEKFNFDTQAQPNMSQETLSPEDAASKRKFPWAQMSAAPVNQSRMR